jgi:membrane fusion protein (multidrug efflux system)
MTVAFSRTLRSLEVAGSRWRVAAWLLPLLLMPWLTWFVLGRVTIFEVSQTARLEVESAAHPVDTLVGGQVVETRLTIGREVAAGEVLIVLDSEPERRAVKERRARCDALATRRQALQKEIQAEQEALAAQRKARAVALDESRALVEQAEAQARFAEIQSETFANLRDHNAISALEASEARARVKASRASVRALSLATTKLEQDRRAQEGERQTQLAKLEREAVELQGEVSIEEAAIRRLEHDIEKHTLRAPVSGRVGEVAEFPVGSVVRAATRLGSIVPPGQPRAVALFPAGSVGRIRAGQPAELRLDGFPWTEYGSLPATVAHVGNEARDGLIRVELTLAGDAAPAIPLEHGLPGTAQIAVEQISPAELVLRAAGQRLAPKASTGGNRE